jgi:hypothetical protein
MGNCECVATSKCGFGDTDEDSLQPKLKIINSDELGIQESHNESLISFSTISIKNFTGSKNASSLLPKSVS